MRLTISHILFFIAIFSAKLNAQIILIGHNQINGTPLKDVRVTLVESGKTIQDLQLTKKTDFTITFAFGKKYKLYVQNLNCPVMFIDIDASNVPEEKQSIKMISEIDIPFYYNNDIDIDTSVFLKPINKITFDGQSKMISDTAYIKKFYKQVIRPQKTEQVVLTESSPISLPSTIAAQILLNNDPNLPVKNQLVTLLDINGKILKTTKTDRFGNFIITTVIPTQIHKIQLNISDGTINSAAPIYLNNSAQKFSLATKLDGKNAEWTLSNSDRVKIINNGYTGNIGGKVVHISKGSKSFFANRNIYLSNKRNTIIKKTKTNNLGAFSFSEIKPDQDYFVGIDAEDIQKGDKLDVLNKDDQYVFSLDTLAGKRISKNFNASNNEKHNALSVSENEMRMSVDAKLYGDNTSNPLGKIKIILLNDAYEVIDSTMTDDLGLFKFKYLPYLKRFFLSAENDKNQLDIFKNILMYSSDDNLIKVMTHVKGTKFVYKPLDAEIKRMQELILEDPWLELDLDKKHTAKNKIIIEPILFDTKQYSLLPTAKETLEKIAMVLKNNTSIKIEISAHTDSKGNDQDNLKLSEQRAKSVTDFLIKNGINSSRLISKGFGETKILNRCTNGTECSDLEHAINRRVEFKILAN